MKIFLVQNRSCEFIVKRPILRHTRQAECTITGFDFEPVPNSNLNLRFCKKLGDQLRTTKWDKINLRSCSLKLTLSTSLVFTNFLTFRLQDGCGILKSLRSFLGADVKVQVVLTRTINGICVPSQSVMSKEMTLEHSDTLQSRVKKEGSALNLNAIWMEGNKKLLRRISLFITTSNEDLLEPVNKIACMNREILYDAIGADAVIVASNGIPVKCHKSFLMFHSSVFSAMFRSDMEEGATGTVHMCDMSEEGVRAFLIFLYCVDDTEANAKCLIAFELLNAGHKYHIAALESAMLNILVSKPIEWYELDLAIDMFQFARNVPSAKELKAKAIEVMKGNLSQLQKSPSYQKLFKEYPQVGVEISLCAFEGWSQK